MFIKLYGRIHIWVNSCSARRNTDGNPEGNPHGRYGYCFLVFHDDVIVGHLPRNTDLYTLRYVFSFWRFSCEWNKTLFSRFRTVALIP